MQISLWRLFHSHKNMYVLFNQQCFIQRNLWECITKRHISAHTCRNTHIRKIRAYNTRMRSSDKYELNCIHIQTQSKQLFKSYNISGNCFASEVVKHLLHYSWNELFKSTVSWHINFTSMISKFSSRSFWRLVIKNG